MRRLGWLLVLFSLVLVACSAGGSGDGAGDDEAGGTATTATDATEATTAALTRGPMTGVITVSSPSQDNCIGSGEAAGFTNAAEVDVTADGENVGHSVLAADGAADGKSCTYKFGITSLDWTAKSYTVRIAGWTLERSGADLQKDNFAIHESIG